MEIIGIESVLFYYYLRHAGKLHQRCISTDMICKAFFLNVVLLLHILPKFTFFSFNIIIVCHADTNQAKHPGTGGILLFEKIKLANVFHVLF